MNVTAKTHDTPFQTIGEACRSTGLSTYYIRQGCRNGTVPHIKSGTKFLVNTRALLEQLDRESREAVTADA